MREQIMLRLRFRVATVLLIVTLVISLTLIARAYVATALEKRTQAAVDQQWGAIGSYLRIERSGPVWYFDDSDPAQVLAVESVRRLFLLADMNGRRIWESPAKRVFDLDSPVEIRGRVATALRSSQTAKTFWLHRTIQGTPYLIRAGIAFR